MLKYEVMRLFKGKRKRWLYFAQKKKPSYAKNKLRNTCTKEDSPFPQKKIKPLHHFEHQLIKKVSPSKCHTPPSSRKQLFDNCDHDINVINNLIDEFSVLDISDCQDNSGLNAFRYTGTLTSSDVPSNRESSNVGEEFEKKKTYSSGSKRAGKAGNGDSLQKFFSQVSCGKFPLNNIAFQLWCDVVDWNENTDTRQMRY